MGFVERRCVFCLLLKMILKFGAIPIYLHWNLFLDLKEKCPVSKGGVKLGQRPMCSMCQMS